MRIGGTMYKIGRNEPCPCGSGKKYKHCCLQKPAENERILRAASRTSSRDELEALLRQPAKIYRLRVALDSIALEKPEEDVFRTFEMEGEDTLYDLHMEIQDVFGWDNDHLYSFYMSGEVGDRKSEYAGDPMGRDLEQTTFAPAPASAAGTELRALDLKPAMRFKYLFDYGDRLLHTVLVEDVRERCEDDSEFPRLVEKGGEPPPQYPGSEEE